MLGDPGLTILLGHLALPGSARVDQRVPKKLLLEQGLPTAADKRAVQEGIEELLWLAALKPGTIGVASFKDETREYLEIAVLAMDVRSGPTGRGVKSGNVPVDRLVELLHRAVPYPVLLLFRQGESWALSIAPKRHSQGETGKVVVEEVETTDFIHPAQPSEAEAAFLRSLSLAWLPQGDLQDLYLGWGDRILGLRAMPLTGAFAVPVDPNQSRQLRGSLEACSRIERDLASFRARVARETQLSKRVDLNLAIQRMEAELAALRISPEHPLIRFQPGLPWKN